MDEEKNSRVDKEVDMSYSGQDMKTITYFLLRDGVAVAWDKDPAKLETRRQKLQAQYKTENFSIIRWTD